jgi:hypothetical protein
METNKKWARKCSATGEGMNEGWCFNDGAYYAKYYEDAIAELRNNFDSIYGDFLSTTRDRWMGCIDDEELSVINENIDRGEISDEALLYMAYALDYVYWTEWDADDDAQYEEINGTLIEIE